MTSAEYSEANNNFRHFVSLERDYLQLFVNSTVFLIAGFWVVSGIPALRYMIFTVGAFLSVGILVTELRYATYFRHFFNVAVEIESEYGGRQFTNITKHFSRPFLGIRSTNVIIAFYVVFSFCWVTLAVADFFDANWFENVVRQMCDVHLLTGA